MVAVICDDTTIRESEVECARIIIILPFPYRYIYITILNTNSSPHFQDIHGAFRSRNEYGATQRGHPARSPPSQATENNRKRVAFTIFLMRHYNLCFFFCGFLLHSTSAEYGVILSKRPVRTCSRMCARVVMPVPVYIYIYIKQRIIYIYYTLDGWDEMDGRESRCTTTNEPSSSTPKRILIFASAVCERVSILYSYICCSGLCRIPLSKVYRRFDRKQFRILVLLNNSKRAHITPAVQRTLYICARWERFNWTDSHTHNPPGKRLLQHREVATKKARETRVRYVCVCLPDGYVFCPQAKAVIIFTHSSIYPSATKSHS